MKVWLEKKVLCQNQKQMSFFKSQRFGSQQKGKVHNVHLRAGSSKMKIFYANKKEEPSLESISKLNVKIGGCNKWKFVG